MTPKAYTKEQMETRCQCGAFPMYVEIAPQPGLLVVARTTEGQTHAPKGAVIGGSTLYKCGFLRPTKK